MTKDTKDAFLLTIDDFGLYPIFDCELRTWLDLTKFQRFSVMTGLGDIAFIKQWIQNTPIALDIHLNSTSPEPIRRRGSSLVQIRNMPRRLGLAWQMVSGGLDRKDIKEIWRNQIEAFIKIFNRVPDGINSHEHIHVYPPYFKVALELALHYRIPYIRLGETIPFLAFEYRTWVLKSFHKSDYALFKKSGLSTSSALYGYDWGRLNLSQIQKRFPKGAEVIFHAHNDRDYRALGELSF